MVVPRETPPFTAEPLLDHIFNNNPLSPWFGKDSPPSLTNTHIDLIPFLFAARLRVASSNFVISLGRGVSLSYLFDLFLALLPFKSFALSSSEVSSFADIQSLALFLSSHSSVLLIHQYTADHWRIKTTPEDPPNTQALPLQTYKYQDVVALLSAWCYERTSSVFSPGSFSVRGGILDVFFFGNDQPLRLEYVGEELSTARYFDPESQRKTHEAVTSQLTVLPPIKISQQNRAGVSLRDFLSKDASFFNVSSVGGSDVLTIVSAASYGLTSKQPVNLNCIPKRPFNENWTALDADLTLIDKKSGGSCAKLIFLPQHVRSIPKKIVFLVDFTPISFPGHYSFYSEPLSLFSTSLNALYRRARLRTLIPTTREPPVKPLQSSLFGWGQPLVHEDLGIGRYRGLSVVETSHGSYEAVDLEYADGDYLHLPMDRLHLVHPYVGSDNDSPALSSLRNSRWAQLKQKTRRSAEKVVQAFLDLYAARHKANGFAFSSDGELHTRLAESFPYEETSGQLNAYEDISLDMERPSPMDRLLCGDVGFGKTEVAIRAAFKAVYDKKQVVVLVPTTILANQHFLSFKSRLEPLGVRVALLSRFTKRSVSISLIRAINRGEVDIVVGTHRLLSQNLPIPLLGLLIVDEEHRFGAKHKELLKAERSTTDVLTLSATPIPRTLQFSLLGIRDISNISTPPRERFPVITVSSPFNKSVIRKAALEEAEAGGQSFFIHNRVKTIESTADVLRELLPNLCVAVAHGQLTDAALESVMLDFLNKKIDVLVCSTIIEAGMDIPLANTIFINNAHKFGLAQLYQMRGRVGRGDRQAFCYLLTPKNKKISTTAAERLRYIQHHTSLGSGYALALQDLQMRGAGNLFGVEQAGHLTSVGHHLYYKIIEEVANRRLERAPETPRHVRTNISIKGEALLPSDYITEIGDRLYFYRLLGETRTVDDVDDVRYEIRDRFGPLPTPAKLLFDSASVQARASHAGIERIKFVADSVTLYFLPVEERGHPSHSFEKLSSVLSARNMAASFGNHKDGTFTLTVSASSNSEAFSVLHYLFDSI